MGAPGPYKSGTRIADIKGRLAVNDLYIRRFKLLVDGGKTWWGHFVDWCCSKLMGQVGPYTIYLHKIVRSDDDADPHDHRWRNWGALILSGGYIDEQWKKTATGREVSNLEQMSAGTWRTRLATHLHRVRLIDEARPTWTLVIRGPLVREWGFETTKGWMAWEPYLAERRAVAAARAALAVT